MIKFVRNGQVVFVESDTGELTFVDKDLERMFIEKAEQVQPDNLEDELLQAANELMEAYRQVESEELKMAIRKRFDKIVTRLKENGINTEDLVLE